MNKKLLISIAAVVVLASSLYILAKTFNVRSDYVTCYVDARKEQLKFYWRDENGRLFQSIENLRKSVESRGKELVFAMNGGMYRNDFSPVGLYIQNKVTLVPLDTTEGTGNFYLKPNGVFYIRSNGTAGISKTSAFKPDAEITYAPQSGPMLVIDSLIHPDFKKRSSNVNVRNGVGIAGDNRVVFVMSKKEVSLYDFAAYFQSLGCRNALYLDGFVSRTYYPEKDWIQTDGNFGVIIAVIK